jgi:hypothetical protein
MLMLFRGKIAVYFCDHYGTHKYAIWAKRGSFNIIAVDAYNNHSAAQG